MEQTRIAVPADAEGFVALRCPRCHGGFKLTVPDLEDRPLLQLYCARCGVPDASDSYLPPDVIEAIEAEATNMAMGLISEAFRDIESKTRGGPLSIRMEKVEPVPVPRLRAIADLAVTEVPCCQTEIKLPFAGAATLFYCPLCGQVQD